MGTAREDPETSAIHDLAFVGDPGGGHGPGLRDREPKPERVPQLHPVQQQNVVDESS